MLYVFFFIITVAKKNKNAFTLLFSENSLGGDVMLSSAPSSLID